MRHFESRHAAEMTQLNEWCLTRSRTEENTNPKAKIVGVLFFWLLAFVAQSRAQEFSAEELAHSAIERRAIEAVIWGMPAVNFDLLCQSMVRAKSEFNQIIYWSTLASWKNQTLTPNPDTIYVFPFFNTKDVGPMVLEIPPASQEADGGSITGSIDDAWQVALEDVGPAGVMDGTEIAVKCV